ncbi:hypothetical protein GCM10023116_08650 [Kistimonas scapharcae]|uniref:Uncharacterized protein n=1 Tax=Kistimonas scapharcae TaxID=1036133 RepID=A0ABP8UXG8_9GAMM
MGDTLPARPVCGARAKSTGRACRNAAGYKTGHPGEGRCHLHGGIAGGAPAGNLNAMYYGLGSRVAGEYFIKFTPEEFMAMTAETVPCRQHVAFARADYHALHRYQQILIRYYEARGEFDASWDVLNVLTLEMNRVLRTISKLKMRAQYHRYGEHYDVGVRVTKYLAGIGVHDEDSFVPMELLYRRTRWPDN